jgi:hypothetical protein
MGQGQGTSLSWSLVSQADPHHLQHASWQSDVLGSCCHTDHVNPGFT